ncbi:MAG: hypothetical protein ACP5GR_04555 [Thermoplasmata archaeon]
MVDESRIRAFLIQVLGECSFMNGTQNQRISIIFRNTNTGFKIEIIEKLVLNGSGKDA